MTLTTNSGSVKRSVQKLSQQYDAQFSPSRQQNTASDREDSPPDPSVCDLHLQSTTA